MRLSTLSLTPLEKTTFRLHLIYSILEGWVFGILALNEFVFLTSMNGSTLQLGILFQISMAVFILLIFFNVFIKRSQKKQSLLRKTAIVTRLPLLLLLFFPQDPTSFMTNPLYHYVFLVLFLLFYLESPVTLPMANLFLKHNYRHDHFGVLYGFSSTVNKIVTLIGTFAYGIILDIDNYAFTYVLPITAIIGVISIMVFSKTSYQEEPLKHEKQRISQSIKESIMTMKNIIIKNQSFRHFEIGFMLYGFAFMITVTVITIFYDAILGLNYISVAFYKNSFNILAIMLIPVFGRLIGRIDPRIFTAFSFFSMMIAIGSIAITEYVQINITFFDIKIFYVMLLYIFFYGLFMASMTLSWRIGSAYFCEKKDSAIYQSIHLSSTGVRALFAPLIGVVIYEIAGFTITFAVAIGVLVIAILILLWSSKNIQLPIIDK